MMIPAQVKPQKLDLSTFTLRLTQGHGTGSLSL